MKQKSLVVLFVFISGIVISCELNFDENSQKETLESTAQLEAALGTKKIFAYNIHSTYDFGGDWDLAIDFLVDICPKKYKIKPNNWIGKIIKKGHKEKLTTRPCIKHPEGIVIEVIVGGGWTGFPFYFSLDQIKNAFYLKVTYFKKPLTPGEEPVPPKEDFDDDLDEPDDFDEPNQPVGPNGCECNNPANDGNICPDDTFGKPNPAEYKSELTVLGRDENFLYIFGKDAALFNRGIFWSDPNSEGLVNCESQGAWDGTFMVHKLQPCRSWFALTNESQTIWLSPDATTTRVVEGVSVVPYGNGYNFTLTCGAKPNNLNLLQPQDYKNSECIYLSLDEALYADKNVCFDDTVKGAPLPSNVKPELTVVARRENYIHIFGKDAEVFHHAVFWANPNPSGLDNFEINGEYGFSTVFKLPPCRTWFAISNDEKTVWLSPNSDYTRVEDGVSVVFDGQGYNFVLTCGTQPNNFNLLSDKDFYY